MFERLSEISKAENINITDDAINEIVQNSNGGLRDAIESGGIYYITAD